MVDPLVDRRPSDRVSCEPEQLTCGLQCGVLGKDVQPNT